ncbi:MAG: IS30 family transposase [Candidatus Thiothrix putei]|uniref:IS30 family transposase n=1 Tax=Candidatus Thiothrix putei TaxID=3080811 RepID=A0AA95KQH7_9GAMM|nr:MAG: IS30 family transposase [Candidatus Thiothrix putei]WGZ94893.1 MAG: IS30 family transposase [Candidatus Thiothrix putei]WGZ95518.1 MAG: IS30 family transposase [Candidatus Thiothrix putei]
MAYTHLTSEERHYIETRHKMKESTATIALTLGRSQSTISRELTRNRGQRGYRHKQAHAKAQQRHADKPKAVKLTPELAVSIDTLLEQQWSPEQISGRLKAEGKTTICHEAIYQHVLRDKRAGGKLYLNLRRHTKKYRQRYGSKTGSVKGIPNRVDIDERPAVANQRERLGDWEADTMIGKGHQGALVTLDERKSKLRLAFPVANKTAEAVTSSIITLLDSFKDWVHTLTFDNGKEFAKHEQVAQALGCETYFAKPYHSWERGQNENANGLLRQYFPKAMGLLDVTTRQVLEAVHKLNNRPRKCLGFKTPYEVFRELSGIEAEKLVGYALIT